MRWWSCLVVSLAMGCQHPDDPGTDTDVDDTDTQPTGPIDGLIALGEHTIDPEFFPDLKLVAWQSPDTDKVWIAQVNPANGQWDPIDGQGLSLGKAASMTATHNAPATFNGPEFGDLGRSVFFTKRDADGFNQVARYVRGSGVSTLLSGGDQVHRSGVIPQLFPGGDRVAVLFFMGDLENLQLAWRWTDDTVDHPFVAASSADPPPRWIPHDDAIAVLMHDAGQITQIGRYDLHTGDVTQLTSDAEYKSDPFITEDPAGGRILTVDVSETVPEHLDELVPTRIAVFREDGDAWTREVTFGVEDTLGGGPYAHGSLEPFLYEGKVWLSFVAVHGTTRADPSQIYVASVDGTQVIQLTTGVAARGDPEVIVLDGHAYLYYTEHTAGGSTNVHVVRNFMP